MSKSFWDEINNDIYWKGGKSIVTWMNEQYPNVSDEEYDRIHMDLATQALQGDFSTVSKEGGYYLICEEFDPITANAYYKKYKSA